MAIANTLNYNNTTLKNLKKGIWIYLILLIFEGSLRKWVLPGLSNVILIIRDPVAMWLMFQAAQAGIRYSNWYIKIVNSITMFSILTALIWGHGNLPVALYGARITLLHFPLVFLIGKVFSREDILEVGKFIVWLTIPMTILIAVQFYSPQSAWINRGIGGNLEGAGFAGTDNYFRPPGTFSFTSGNSAYYSFAVPFILFFIFHSDKIKRSILYISLFAFIAAIGFSISRTIFFSFTISILFLIISFRGDGKKTSQIVSGIIGVAVLLVILSSIDFFGTSFGAFTDRFTAANENEGGVRGVFLDRFLGGSISAITNAAEAGHSFFGAGIGYGTNAGSQLATGETVFLISEGEWGRIIGEMGALLGLILVFVRISITNDIFKLSYKKLLKKDVLAWLLLSYSLLNLAQGGWSQPTNLGFFVMSGGLTLAATNDNLLIS